MKARAREALEEEPPVSPGQGPFGIKGIGYLGHMRWVADHYPGGTEAYLLALSPSMRAFFGQTFFAMSFFDLMPLVCAGHTCARVMGMSFFDFVVMRSRLQAESDLHGVYRAALKLANPRLVATRIPNLMNQYFDFIESHMGETETHRVRFELRGVPSMFAEWIHAAYEGFAVVVVKATGGVAPNIEVDIEPSAPVKGHTGCRMRIMFQWS